MLDLEDGMVMMFIIFVSSIFLNIEQRDWKRGTCKMNNQQVILELNCVQILTCLKSEMVE